MLESIKLFVNELRHARRVKGHLVRQASEKPELFLQTYSTLPAEDQKYLTWLKKIADSNLKK